MAIYGSADSLARNPNVVGQRAASAERNAYPKNPDPYNWKAIAAQLKKEEDARNAAKNRIKNPAAPKAVSTQSVAAPAAPPPSAKELLDAFRAMNGGALPPGMTPEMAAMIDQGIDINAISAVNPGIAGVMAQMQGLITALPADYAAGKASVNASYDQLTGDVLDSGKNWMQDLYGRIVDPNDPNAALAQADPALTEYAQGMSTIDETSDANRATDLAWFDKMQQNADATYKGLLASLATQAMTPAAGSGGGGGGGRGRGGRGGGGSGGGSSEWKTPTNTLTNLTSATDTATQTDAGYSPGFHEALMEATQFDPDLQALTQRIWEGSSQDARGMTQETAKRLTEAETQQEDLALQGGLHTAWTANTPGQVQSAITKLLRNNPGAVLGDDPTTKTINERWHIPRQEGDPNAGVVRQVTEEQQIQNDLAEELLAARSGYGAQQMTNKIFGTKQHTPVGVLSPEGQLEQSTKGGISPRQIQILAQRGKAELSKQKSTVAPGVPFSWNDWAGGGGYVPEPDRATTKENARNMDYYNYILDTILPWNPNANTVPTSEKMVSQGKDSSTFQTKNTNKSFTNALSGSPYDLTPQLSDQSVASNPVSNPAGFDITVDDSGDETVALGGGGMSLTGLRVPRSQFEGIQSAAKDAISVAQGRPTMSAIFGGKTIGRPKAPITPKPVKAAAKVIPKPRSDTKRASLTDRIFGPKKSTAAPRTAPATRPGGYPKKTPAKKAAAKKVSSSRAR